MKKAIAKPEVGSGARRLTLCNRPASVECELQCGDGAALATTLIDCLKVLFRNWDACRHVTGVTLRCPRGAWKSGELGHGSVTKDVSCRVGSESTEQVTLSYSCMVDDLSSGASCGSVAELQAAISGLFGALMTQCHQKHDLAASEEMYKQVLHAISDVAILTDAEGRITYVCPNADGFCGRSLDEIMQLRTIFEILGPESECLETMVTGVSARDVNTELMAKNGSKVTVLTDVINTDLPQGPFLFTFRDVTELTEAREELADACSKLQEGAKTLARKNIALEELLSRAGRDCYDRQASTRESIEANVMPLVEALSEAIPPSHEPLIGTLTEMLRQLTVPPNRRQIFADECLTARELQVLNMVGSGYSSKQIAAILNISAATVVNTRKRIRKKLHISGRACSLPTAWRKARA